jgi:hypothetical protein
MRKHYKKRFPTANINWLNATIATDTFSDIPAKDDGIRLYGGATMLQFYSRVKSLLS